MRILILSEFVRRFPWSGGLWAAHLSAALAGRGHEVTAACDGLEDPTAFAGVRLLVRSPLRGHRKLDPRAFAQWGRSLVASAEFDGAISMTPLVPAHLWAPVAPTAAGLVRTLINVHGAIGSVLELASRGWIPAAMMAESRAREEWHSYSERRGWVVGHLGTNSAPGGTIPLGFASRFERLTSDDRAALRRDVRRVLGIPEGHAVVLISAVHPEREGLAGLLGGIAQLTSAGQKVIPVIAGRRTHIIAKAAQKAGCWNATRIIGGTDRMDALLAGADIAVSPWRHTGPSGGRFVADALRLGCPVLARKGSPGAELVEPEFFGTPEVGGVISGPEPEAWSRAAGDALSRDRLGSAARAARDVSAAIGMDSMAARIEGVLGAVR